MYVTDVFRSVNNCCVGQSLNNAHIELLGGPIERYEAREEVEHARVIVSSTKDKRCVEENRYVHYIQVQI